MFCAEDDSCAISDFERMGCMSCGYESADGPYIFRAVIPTDLSPEDVGFNRWDQPVIIHCEKWPVNLFPEKGRTGVIGINHSPNGFFPEENENGAVWYLDFENLWLELHGSSFVLNASIHDNRNIEGISFIALPLSALDVILTCLPDDYRNSIVVYYRVLDVPERRSTFVSLIDMLKEKYRQYFVEDRREISN